MEFVPPRRRLDVEGASLFLVEVTEPAGFDPMRLPLSADERREGMRFHHAADRARFMLSRAALRALVAEKIGAAPQALIFSKGPYGKPALVAPSGAPLHFNVSHSGDFALIGLADRPIGVDIEKVRANLDELALAEAFFCAEEHRFLAGLDGDFAVAAFYRIWTAKEAVLKAFGVGITEYLKDFRVIPTSGRLALTPQPRCFAKEMSRVRLAPVTVPAGYAAALALI